MSADVLEMKRPVRVKGFRIGQTWITRGGTRTYKIVARTSHQRCPIIGQTMLTGSVHAFGEGGGFDGDDDDMPCDFDLVTMVEDAPMPDLEVIA